MITTYKVLAQSNPAANTDTTLLTVEAGKQLVASTLSVCNQAATSATFRVAVRPGGEALAAKHYVCYNISVPANDTVLLTIGMTLTATDALTIRANSATMSFSLFGAEISR